MGLQRLCSAPISPAPWLPLRLGPALVNLVLRLAAVIARSARATLGRPCAALDGVALNPHSGLPAYPLPVSFSAYRAAP